MPRAPGDGSRSSPEGLWVLRPGAWSVMCEEEDHVGGVGCHDCGEVKRRDGLWVKMRLLMGVSAWAL